MQAAEEVVHAAADQHVTEVGADHALDADQAVVALATGGLAELQIDLHAGRGGAEPVVHDVEAVSAIDGVVALAAREQVACRMADQRVVAAAAECALDVDQHVVACRARRPACRDVDLHGTGRIAVVGIVELQVDGLAAAVQHVVAGTAAQRVLALHAAEPVVAAIADQQVVQR